MSTPKDGFYTARVFLDTGGAVRLFVRVLGGVPYSGHAINRPMLPEACSQFEPVSTPEFCQTWSDEAALELDTLRAANRALVDRVKRLEEAKAAGISLMRAADPFFLNPDDEGDDGISIRQLDESARVTWDEPPTAGEHLALYDAVLEFGRASLETLEAKP